MAYKQPNVPRMSAGDGYIPALTRFLRDFCLSAWNADRQKDAEIEMIRKRLDAIEDRLNDDGLNGKEG